MPPCARGQTRARLRHRARALQRGARTAKRRIGRQRREVEPVERFGERLQHLLASGLDFGGERDFLGVRQQRHRVHPAYEERERIGRGRGVDRRGVVRSGGRRIVVTPVGVDIGVAVRGPRRLVAERAGAGAFVGCLVIQGIGLAEIVRERAGRRARELVGDIGVFRVVASAGKFEQPVDALFVAQFAR